MWAALVAKRIVGGHGGSACLCGCVRVGAILAFLDLRRKQRSPVAESGSSGRTSRWILYIPSLLPSIQRRWHHWHIGTACSVWRLPLLQEYHQSATSIRAMTSMTTQVQMMDRAIKVMILRKLVRKVARYAGGRSRLTDCVTQPDWTMAAFLAYLFTVSGGGHSMSYMEYSHDVEGVTDGCSSPSPPSDKQRPGPRR